MDKLHTEFSVVNDWSEYGGFQGQLKFDSITKTSDGWELTFDAPFEITDIWNGEIVSREGITYTIKNASYNGNLKQGDTVELGFIADTDTKSIEAPKKFRFEGGDSSYTSVVQFQSDDKNDVRFKDETFAITPPQENGFRIEQGRIVDGNGKDFVPRGVNSLHVWFDDNGEPITQAFDSLDNLAKMGANSVRIVWQKEFLGRPTSDEMLDKIIARTVELNMVPVIGLWDATGSQDPNKLLDLVDWWVEKKDLWNKWEKYAFLNIANEFGDYHMAKNNRGLFPELYKQAISRIRDAGIENPLAIDPFSYGQDGSLVSEFGQEIIKSDPLKNTLFDIHVYGEIGSSKSDISDLFNDLTSQKIPFFIGEFNSQHPAPWRGQGKFDNIEEAHLIQEANKHGIGYYAWAWYNPTNDYDFSLATNWEASSKDELTPFGKTVFDGEGGITDTSVPASIFTENS